MNVKTKMNYKTLFLIMFSILGRIWIHDVPHAGWEPLAYSIRTQGDGKQDENAN